MPDRAHSAADHGRRARTPAVIRAVPSGDLSRSVPRPRPAARRPARAPEPRVRAAHRPRRRRLGVLPAGPRSSCRGAGPSRRRIRAWRRCPRPLGRTRPRTICPCPSGRVRHRGRLREAGRARSARRPDRGPGRVQSGGRRVRGGRRAVRLGELSAPLRDAPRAPRPRRCCSGPRPDRSPLPEAAGDRAVLPLRRTEARQRPEGALEHRPRRDRTHRARHWGRAAGRPTARRGSVPTRGAAALGGPGSRAGLGARDGAAQQLLLSLKPPGPADPV